MGKIRKEMGSPVRLGVLEFGWERAQGLGKNVMPSTFRWPRIGRLTNCTSDFFCCGRWAIRAPKYTLIERLRKTALAHMLVQIAVV